MLQNLRTVRLAHRLTQLDVARRAGLQQVYISALERGLAPADARHVTKIARALGVDPNTLTSEAVIVAADGTVRVA